MLVYGDLLQERELLMPKLAPSILSADFAFLGRDVALVTEGGADYLHVDVMDGHFVPNISIGAPVVKSLKKVAKLPLDVHLMIDGPARYADPFLDAGADILTVHWEASPPEVIADVVRHIRGRGARPCVSVKPATPASAIGHLIPELSMVLVMTVEPGFGGQAMIPETVGKVRELRGMIDAMNPGCELEVDGGVYLENVHVVLEAGADVIVAGNAVFSAEDVAGRVREFKKAFSALT